MERRTECEKFNELAYWFGKMSAAEVAAYEAHLRECDSCKVLGVMLRAKVAEKLVSGEVCLTDAEFEEASVGVAAGTRIDQHLKMCPFCRAAVEARREVEQSAPDVVGDLPEYLRTLIGELKGKKTARIYEFPIKRLQPLASQDDEELRLAAEEKSKAAPRYERFEREQTVVVASISLSGDFIVTVERQGVGISDTNVAVEQGSTAGDSNEIVSQPTDRNGQVNFGPVKNFAPPRPGWFLSHKGHYRMRVRFKSRR